MWPGNVGLLYVCVMCCNYSELLLSASSTILTNEQADVPNLASFTNPSDDYNPKLSDGNVYECDRLNTRRLELAPWPSRSEGCWPRSGSQLTGDDAITMCEVSV